MKKLKEEKGITLVALIITIVVLLILASVAIGTVRDSDIIGYAQNAAGSFNQAKANEVDTLTKYEEEIEKYVPGDKKEDTGEEKVYLGDLRLNAKYIKAGKGENQVYLIFYPNGTVDYSGAAILNYTIIDDRVEFETEEGKIPLQIIKEEKNDILTLQLGTTTLLFATSTNGLLYLNGREYTTNQEAYVNKIKVGEDGTYTFYKSAGGSVMAGTDQVLVFYNGVVYHLNVDTSSDSHDDSPIATSTDNCETINIGNVIYTRTVE